MTCHRVCNDINTTDATSGAGTAYPFGAPEFTPGFSRVRITRSIVLCVCFVVRCLSFCLLAIALCVLLRLTYYDCLFGIFKLLLHFDTN